MKRNKLQHLQSSVEVSSGQKTKRQNEYVSHISVTSEFLCVCDFHQTLLISPISFLSVTLHSQNFPYKICKTEYRL